MLSWTQQTDVGYWPQILQIPMFSPSQPRPPNGKTNSDDNPRSVSTAGRRRQPSDDDRCSGFLHGFQAALQLIICLA